MSNPFGNGDVENGRGDFTIDDESTLQPPPSEPGSFDSDDMHNINVNNDNGGHLHDQLPTPEEYKAQIKGEQHASSNAGVAAFAQFSPSKEAAELSEAGSVYGDDRSVAVHDQLPNVDEYKAAAQQRRRKGFRAGFWTFFILLLIVGIITAITVPLVLKAEEQQTSSASSSTSGGSSGNNGGSSSGGSSSSGSSGTSGTSPPTNPRPPETEAEKTRYEHVIDYLVAIGASTRATLEEDRESPQYKAANWIANVDEFAMSLPSGSGFEAPEELPVHTRFTERYALAVFYYALGGPSWKYSMRFMEPRDHCEWYQDFITASGNILRLGVSDCKNLGTGFEEQLVHGLELPNNGLTGDLPTELQLLHRLTKLALPFNADLTNEKSLEGLRTLEYLTDIELQYCSLSGQIPDWFGNLRELTNLGLGNNALVGQLPDNFFRLTKLALLGLDDNGFVGPISSFSALSNLDSLYLEDNAFTGELTGSLFGAWSKMIELDLSFNKLDGPLPSNMWSISSLEVMDIHGNTFVGPIPEITAPHDNLYFLALHDNKLDWRIPESINNLKNLAHLDVSKNNLVLPFPGNMKDLTNLRYLFTGQNPFEDHRIPGFLRQMTNLRELSMKDNSLTGPISPFLGSLTRLQVLDLDQNKLEGQIPNELGQLTGVDTLMLNRNNLNGTIPQSFAQLNDLDIFLLDGNDIGGTADVICGDPSLNLTQFVADCAQPNPEIVCTCCNVCCDDSNTTCNNFDWHVNLDPIWEYGYRRVVYSFSQNLLPPEDAP